MTDFGLSCPQSTVPLSQGYNLCYHWWQNVIKPNQKGTWYDMNPQKSFRFKEIALLLLTYTFFWLPNIYINVLQLMDAWPNTLRTEQNRPPWLGFASWAMPPCLSLLPFTLFCPICGGRWRPGNWQPWQMAACVFVFVFYLFYSSEESQPGPINTAPLRDCCS